MTVFWLRGNGRSQRIAQALTEGARRAGYKVALRSDDAYERPAERVVAFYGFQKNMPRIMADQVESGRTVVFIDLGYWGRHHGGRFNGYHKVAVNSRHPSKYFMARNRDPSRLKTFDLDIKPWRSKGGHIILAGMSGKSALSHNMRPEQWEKQAVKEIRQYTKRPIFYRPKPSWQEAKPIPGTIMQRGVSLDIALQGCHAVVTHHSNVAVDAIVAGIPAFCMEGVAACMSEHRLSRIERPRMPDGREQWMANIAWCQWNVHEMANGSMWRHLKSENLIP